METINLKVSEIAISNKEVVIETNGVGSCIVICLYDKEAKIGGMSHSMLPSSKKYKDATATKLGKYADEAIKNLYAKIIEMGGQPQRIKAKISGGAEMFSHLSHTHFNVGKENVESAKTTLESLNIPIIGESIGGSVGRMVSFDLSTCTMNVVIKI